MGSAANVPNTVRRTDSTKTLLPAKTSRTPSPVFDLTGSPCFVPRVTTSARGTGPWATSSLQARSVASLEETSCGTLRSRFVIKKALPLLCSFLLISQGPRRSSPTRAALTFGCSSLANLSAGRSTTTVKWVGSTAKSPASISMPATKT